MNAPVTIRPLGKLPGVAVFAHATIPVLRLLPQRKQAASGSSNVFELLVMKQHVRREE